MHINGAHMLADPVSGAEDIAEKKSGKNPCFPLGAHIYYD
jgi:hypothetical protein